MEKGYKKGKGPVSKLGKADDSSISAQASSVESQSITIHKLDGTPVKLTLPKTSTVRDLKTALEKQVGIHPSQQKISVESKEDPLSNDMEISHLDQGDKDTLTLFIIHSPLQKMLTSIRSNSLDDGNAAELAKVHGMYFDRVTGLPGATCISDFWSGAHPNYTWEGPEGWDPEFKDDKIRLIKDAFDQLHRTLDQLHRTLENQFRRSFIPTSSIERVKQCLEEFGSVNVNAPVMDSDGRTLLHFAVMYDNIDIARTLIDKGADVNTKNKLGRTPLHYASGVSQRFGGDMEVIKLLLAHEADGNIRDEGGDTSLHTASSVTPLMLQHQKARLLTPGPCMLLQC